MSAIVDIVGREVLDSRGNPTVECDVLLESGVMGRAACRRAPPPAAREAIELRDGDKARYLGKGVLKAVEHQHRNQRSRAGLDASEQAFLDKTLIDLDGTENKSRLGANAMLASPWPWPAPPKKPACRCTATSAAWAVPTAVPMMNVINGGAHANNSLTCRSS